MSGAFLIAAWHPEDHEARETAARIEASVMRTPNIAIMRTAGLMIAAQGARVERPSPSHFMIGDLFSGSDQAPAPNPGQTDHRGFRDYCSRLLSTHWGSYIILRHNPHAHHFLSVFAEPIGSRECIHWRHGGVTMLGCDAEPWLGQFPPLQLDLDLEEIAHIIHYPSQAAETAPLSGITPLESGGITYFTRSGHETQRLWTPRDHCVEGDRSDDPAALAQIVDKSIAAWSSGLRRPIMELSGGLDSAIVAASLHRAGLNGIDAFTFFSDSLAGDERRFSRAVAEKLGFVPHEIAFKTAAMDPHLIDSAAIGIRPGIGSTTFFHDRPLANIGSARQADALFTGRGGDALFFQHPTPLVAQHIGPGGKRLTLEHVEALARWCQTSVWRVAMATFLPAMFRSVASGSQSRFCRYARPSRPSTWAGSLDGLSAGKRMQIEAIAGDRNAFGPSCCAQAMRVIHPLLSQPIVEYVLGQSLMTLTQGRRDRAMARAAFADRLPPSLIDRRGKGALSYFFGQTLARSTALLRERLLEGALAETGLVDRASLEQALDPANLIQSSCYGEIIRLLIVERWMRGWKEQRAQPRVQAGPLAQDAPSETR